MKNYLPLLAALALTAMSCRNDAAADAKADAAESLNPSSQEIIVNNSPNSKVYEFRRDDLAQTLTVNWQASGDVTFILTSENRPGNCNNFISGAAKLVKGQAAQEKDASGAAFETESYLYESAGCNLTLRIAKGSRDKARVDDSACRLDLQNPCVYGSLGLMSAKE